MDALDEQLVSAQQLLADINAVTFRPSYCRPLDEPTKTADVPSTGSFYEPVTVKMTGPKTGQSKTENYNLSVEVKQLQEQPNQ